MPTPLTAASTYANMARIASEAQRALLPPPGTATPKSETSFASVLKDAIASVNEIGHKSDVQTRAAASGKSNMVDVVTAVAETEVAWAQQLGPKRFAQLRKLLHDLNHLT